MLVRPGVSYPQLGGVVDGVRYPARDVVDTAQTQFYANSRGTLRFLRMNRVARNAGFQWPGVPPAVREEWNAFSASTASWSSALCRMKTQPYADPPGATPAIFTGVQEWRAAIGVEQTTDVPEINTQPGGDSVAATATAPGGSPPACLAAYMWLTWSRNNVPAVVPYYLAVSARAALTWPAGDPHPTKCKWGGWLPITYGVPICIDALLAATGRMLLGTVIVMHVAIGEIGSVPFFAGQVLIRNVWPQPGPAVGWGTGAWGSMPWGS